MANINNRHDIQVALQQGMTLLREGDSQAASRLLREVLQVDPRNPDALHLLGLAALENGDNKEAARLIKRAIKANPAVDFYHENLGKALFESGHYRDAIAALKRAVALNGRNAEAYNRLGVIFRLQGREQEAVRAFNKAIGIAPDYLQPVCNLAQVLITQGRSGRAIELLEPAVERNPRLDFLHCQLGDALRAGGRLDDAIAAYRQAIAINGRNPDAHNRLGIALDARGEAEAALQSFRRAVEIDPGDIGARNNLGVALQRRWRLDEALEAFNGILGIAPDYPDAHKNIAITLKAQARPEEAAEAYRKVLATGVKAPDIHSDLLLMLNYTAAGQEEIHAQSLRWDERYAAPLGRKKAARSGAAGAGSRLRIGYISPDFRSHSVACFFEPLLQAHDRNRVEVYCYANVKQPDEVTGRLEAASDHWRSILGEPDAEAARRIRADRLDILVDLAGHTADNRLLVLAHRPAPVQATWLGYPNTTGMGAIDYRITDGIADPEGEADRHYRERLIRLPAGFLCYRPDERAPGVSRPPCLDSGHITFGSFNNLLKVSAGTIEVWSRILHAVPASRLLLKSRQLADEGVKRNCLAKFEREGISPGRIELHAELPDKRDHLALYGKIDIALDPFPYNGTTTTCEALWMGVPVVARRGERHSARVGASLLTHAGLAELIADDVDAYVGIASELASDRDRLAGLRRGLRDHLTGSALMDAAAFARELENAYFRMAGAG